MVKIKIDYEKDTNEFFKTIKVSAATNKPVRQGGFDTRLTTKALEGIARTAAGKPVLMEFDEQRPIGKVIAAEVIDGVLFVTMNLPKKNISTVKQYLAPCYITQRHMEVGKSKIIEYLDAEAVSFGLTQNHIEAERVEPIERSQSND